MTEIELRDAIIKDIKKAKANLLDSLINALIKCYGEYGYIKIQELKCLIDRLKEDIEND